jgi:hypothetical protein
MPGIKPGMTDEVTRFNNVMAGLVPAIHILLE